jgi:hypothetical protein
MMTRNQHQRAQGDSTSQAKTYGERIEKERQSAGEGKVGYIAFGRLLGRAHGHYSVHDSKDSDREGRFNEECNDTSVELEIS